MMSHACLILLFVWWNITTNQHTVLSTPCTVHNFRFTFWGQEYQKYLLWWILSLLQHSTNTLSNGWCVRCCFLTELTSWNCNNNFAVSLYQPPFVHRGHCHVETGGSHPQVGSKLSSELQKEPKILILLYRVLLLVRITLKRALWFDSSPPDTAQPSHLSEGTWRSWRNPRLGVSGGWQRALFHSEDNECKSVLVLLRFSAAKGIKGPIKAAVSVIRVKKQEEEVSHTL